MASLDTWPEDYRLTRLPAASMALLDTWSGIDAAGGGALGHPHR
jgi:hypothetical protein